MGSLNLACIGFATVCALATSAFAADPPQTPDNAPTTVYVSAEQGMLYSGPGEDFYPTGKIDQNSSLEVYLQAPGDWLGVRPPKGSFSWVQAADAYLLPGGRMIEVTNPAAVSWIGTELGAAKQYRWQVKLTPGEQLGVVGEQTTRGEDGKEVLWYKIAPPAGEFRWIQATSVRTQPVSTTRQAPATGEPKTSSKAGRTNAAVVSAAYQTKQAPGVINLGDSGDYGSTDGQSTAPFIVSGEYPRAPRPGEIINGEVVVGEQYAPGQVIHEQTADGGFAEEGSGGTGYYDGQYIEGDYIDGQDYAGEYIPGEIVEGDTYYDGSYGEVIYDGQDYIDGVVRSSSKGAFAGWHALELTDDGMRFTWLERLYGRARQNGPDPLRADPFSLAMNTGQVRPNSPLAVQQMYPEGMPQTAHVQHAASPEPRRRHRPWRDPRMLGDTRSSSGGGLSAAAALAARDRATEQTDLGPSSGEPFGVGARLQRLADAFNGASDTRASSQANIGSAAADAVNWYGVGSGATAATLAGHQTTLTSAAESPHVAARNVNLDQLQLSLSEAVTQPMQMWSLQPIYDAARYQVEHGASAVERGQARLLMERVEEFAELAARSGYLALNRTSLGNATAGSDIAGTNTVASPIMLASATRGPSDGVIRSDFQRAVEGGASYDATGWLVPVIAASAGQPSHALTDDLGRIQAYVSPVPGLNLNRYINQAVGITGLRGYLPQLQAGHIQASRVVRLQ